jgi:hypothetical protein
VSRRKKSDSDNPLSSVNPLSPVDLLRIVPMPEIKAVSGLSPDTWYRRYPAAIIRMSPRACGVRLQHALFLVPPPPGLPAAADNAAVDAQLADARAVQRKKRAAAAAAKEPAP